LTFKKNIKIKKPIIKDKEVNTSALLRADSRIQREELLTRENHEIEWASEQSSFFSTQSASVLDYSDILEIMFTHFSRYLDVKDCLNLMLVNKAFAKNSLSSFITIYQNKIKFTEEEIKHYKEVS
jgi:hypothetical protein